MGKSYRMLSPFAVVTGNVSGAQDLEYPLNGGSAFDAPAGSKQYAQNYKPRFIMHERKSDGKLYFQLRQRSCVHKTTKSILAMAAIGACGAIVGAILADKTSALYIALENAYVTSKPKRNGKSISFRAFLSEVFIPQLKAKMPVLFRNWNDNGLIKLITINNPFVSGGSAQYDVTISNDVLVKFWSVLANNPITFYVDGQKGIAHQGDDFGVLVAGHYNTLRLTKVTIEELGDMIKFGDEYVTREVDDAPITVQNIDIIDGSENYFLDSEYHTAG